MSHDLSADANRILTRMQQDDDYCLSASQARTHRNAVTELLDRRVVYHTKLNGQEVLKLVTEYRLPHQEESTFRSNSSDANVVHHLAGDGD